MPRLVGIFGGTFDPVHNGHTKTIDFLQRLIPFEKILIIPNALPAHRENSYESFQHRFKMTSIAFQCIDKTLVDDRENLRNGPSYAIDTVKEVLAWNLSVEIPTSAPKPYSKPSAQQVGTLCITELESTFLKKKEAFSLFSVTIQSV